MIKNVCIVGYGSIGKKHHDILKKNFNDLKISIISKHLKKKDLIYNKISDIKTINPDYIIICSITRNHFKDLKYIDNLFSNKIILVEKPLFIKCINYPLLNNKIYIAYNLRFHPVIKFIKKIIRNKKIIETNIYSGSYLPSWRKLNYSNSYSASKVLGGGVKLDLSHELDYCLFLLGDYKINFYINKKISNLKIKSEDYLTLIGQTSNKSFINISLNYFSKISTRRIIINGNNLSLNADLINNTVEYCLNNKLYKKVFSKDSLIESYYLMHKSLFDKNYKCISTLEDGLKVMKLIDRLK